MKKKIKKFLCIVFCLAFIINGTEVKAAARNVTVATTEDFELVNDETVVFYYEGKPIKKGEMKENGIFYVGNDSIEEIVLDSIAAPCGAEPVVPIDSNVIMMPYSYNNAVVKTVLSSVNFSQTTTVYYLTNKDGEKFAAGLVKNGGESYISSFLTQFIPVVGPIISTVLSFNDLRNSSVSAEIRTYTDRGVKVKITEGYSRYGHFCVVNNWTGRAIETVHTYTGATERLVSLQYK